MAANPMAAQRKLTPAERAINFAKNTRLWRQDMAAQTAAAGAKARFNIDKVGLLHKIRLLCETTLTGTHASSTDMTVADLAPWSLLEQIKVGANLAYTPWDTSGIGAYMLSLFRQNPGVLHPVTGAATQANADKRRWAYMGNKTDSDGVSNTVVTMYDLPIAVNDRDPVGLILAQNQQTQLTVEAKVGVVTDLVPTAAGFTTSLGTTTITPTVETFTVPPMEEAIPDLSVVKTVQEQNETTTAGKHIFKLPVGPTYRKIAWRLTDSDGNPIDDSALSGDIELQLNVGDRPIVTSGEVLQRIYQEQTGAMLPRGIWGLDFTYQGLMNYGGSRDYLDTEGLTEAWIIIRHASALNLKVVYEGLERMGG